MPHKTSAVMSIPEEELHIEPGAQIAAVKQRTASASRSEMLERPDETAVVDNMVGLHDAI
jgi:GTP cyclohydrolase FolE2